MVNYQNGKIYKIVSDNTDKIYIGSTTEKYLSRRLQGHLRNFKHGNKRQKMSSYEILEFDKPQIILLEMCPCNTNAELKKRERHYIETLDCVNKYIPGRTPQEYHLDNKEKRNHKSAKHYEDNREHYNEMGSKRYYENKEEILKKGAEVINCDCGLTYTHNHKARHYKSQRHIKLINDV